MNHQSDLWIKCGKPSSTRHGWVCIYPKNHRGECSYGMPDWPVQQKPAYLDPAPDVDLSAGPPHPRTTIQQAHRAATELQRHLGAGTPYVTRYNGGAVAHVELAEDITLDTLDGGRFRLTVHAGGYIGSTATDAVHAAVADCRDKAGALRVEADALDRLAEAIKAASPNLWSKQK